MADSLQLYDTLSRRPRRFRPSGDTVTIYVCGVTPYDTTHLGHAFTFGAFDVLIRYLRYLGYRVRYVQNVTDIDDPLFERARQIGVSYQELAARETERYLADMRALNMLPADVYPHASREVPDMVELVDRLLANGHAYAVDGRVYFSIATDPQYGELSGCDRAEMIELARERGGDPDDPRRRDPLDFLLWRPAGEGEPSYPAPWGAGLPGWHIECSTMSLKYLGAPVDIHGGGADLIFPHHESEIAQSEGATGVRPFARYWMHTAMVYLGGEKMSKSLGNMVFARKLLETYSSDAIRLYLAGHHYRSPLHYDEAEVAAAARLADELHEAASVRSAGGGAELAPVPHRNRFLQCMNDDLDTPGAVRVLRDLAGEIRAGHDTGRRVQPAQALLTELSAILGLRLTDRE